MRKKTKKKIIKINNNQQVTNSYNYFPWLLKNIVAAVFIISLIIIIVVPRDCYYTIRQLMRNDMEVFRELPKAETSLDDRFSVMLKEGFFYLQQLRDNTPEDAIILYPEYNDFFPANVETIFENSGISSKMWAIRFLYPRKVIKPSELETSPYKDKITHVAIVNGHEYQYLHYKMEEHYSFGVLPIDATEEDIQIMTNNK